MKKSKLIIKFADKELSRKDREMLEQELYKDPKLMQEYLTHVELNDFLKKKFMPEYTEKDVLTQYTKKESLEKKSLDAETEAFNNGVFHSTIDLIKGWKEESKDNEYSNELKEFAALGINEMKEKAKQKRNLKLEKKTDEIKKAIFPNKWYFIAASVAALFVISFILIKYSNSAVDNSELFASYYHSYHFVTDQTRSSDLTVDSLVIKAVELYKSENYTEASKVIINALELNDKHVKARFLHGLTLLEAGGYSDAANEFNSILSDHDSYNIESRWYLALCYLKLEKTQQAKKLLKELSHSKNLYQKRALEILLELELDD